MELKEIKAIIDLMTKNGLSEFELERDEFKIRVKRAAGGYEVAPMPVVMPPSVANAALPVASAPAAPAPAVEDSPSIDSPMVGTFYACPAPDAPPFVSVGKEVNEDTVVCIIEAMKVMNEIKAETRGVITQVLVDSGKSVEFGTPLFKIRPL